MKYLTEQDIMKTAPSVFQTHSGPRVTKKYRQITTAHMIDSLQNLNWFPVYAQEVKARKVHTKGFQKHLIKFQNPDLNYSSELLRTNDTLHPEILLINSHDGLNAFKFRFGLYRTACINGLIVPMSEFGKFRILHKGEITLDEVEDGVYEYVSNVSPIVDKISLFQQLLLTDKQRTSFGKRALELRYGSYEDSPLDIEEIITPRREEDEQNNLWSTFNIVQENLMYPERYDLHAKQGSKKRVRPLKGIDASVHFNAGLWNLMSKYATLVQ